MLGLPSSVAEHGVKWMKKKQLIFMAAALAVILVAAYVYSGQVKVATDRPKLRAVVTIPPLAEFVEKVGGEKVNATVMVPPGANPHTYEPTPSQLKGVGLADMYVKVGSGIEFELAWMGKIVEMNKDMLIVDSSKGIRLLDGDPHIWLSPLNAKVQVENIYRGLAQVDPKNREYYAENRDHYLEELNSLDAYIRENLSEVSGRSFIVYHPNWGYFAREYGLEQIPIEYEGKEPSARDIASLVDMAKNLNIKVVFASPEFSAKTAEVLAKEIGGKVVFLTPLAKEYVENLRTVTEELAQGLK